MQQQRTDGIQGAFFWQRAPHESSPFQVKNDRGIYIQNANSPFNLSLDFNLSKINCQCCVALFN